MSEIKTVIVTIQRPSGSGPDSDPGRVAYGHFKVEGKLLTMTDKSGGTIRRINSGEPYTHTLQPGDDPEALARVYTRKIHEMITGGSSNFNRRLNYPRHGIA